MTYDEFLDRVQERLPLEDRDEVADFATAVLKTFSELLFRSERDALSNPLAKPLARAIHAAKRENNRRETDRFPPEEFINRVIARTEKNLNREDAQSYSFVVFDVLAEAAGGPLFMQVVEKLPQGYTSLLPSYEDTGAS